MIRPHGEFPTTGADRLRMFRGPTWWRQLRLHDGGAVRLDQSTTGGCFQTLVIDDSAFGLMPEVFGYVAFDDPEPTRVIR
jgi:hypothetical protein